MPPILTRLVGQLKAGGMVDPKAHATATAVLQKAGDLKKGSAEATPKGGKRGAMTPAARAKDRASTYSGDRKPGDYAYDAKTNRAKLK